MLWKLRETHLQTSSTSPYTLALLARKAPRRSAREKQERPHACHPGVTYYFNPSTKQTQWTKPTSVKG